LRHWPRRLEGNAMTRKAKLRKDKKINVRLLV
jgi:hypothetical protein